MSTLPYQDQSSSRYFTIEGRPVEPEAADGMYQLTMPSYFPTLRIRCGPAARSARATALTRPKWW